MQTLFQNRVISIILLVIIIIIANNSFAGEYPKISVRNDQPAITNSELQMINSKIKSISGDRWTGLTGGDIDDSIYIYGKMRFIFNSNCEAAGDCEIPVIAVQFWMIGGNSDFQYLIVLDRKNKKVYGPLKIGGNGYREVAIYNIKDHMLLACARFYGPKDALPDPSLSGIIRFSLDPSGIQEHNTIVNIDSLPKKCIPRP
jgi:hypothetical protein